MFWSRKKKQKELPVASTVSAPLSRLKIDVTTRGDDWGVLFTPELDLPRMHLWAKDALVCLVARALLDAKHTNPVLATIASGALAGVVKRERLTRFRNRPKVFNHRVHKAILESAEKILKVELVSHPLRPAMITVSGNLTPVEGMFAIIQQLILCLKDTEIESLVESIAAPLMAFEETRADTEETIEERALRHRLLLVAGSNPGAARQFGIDL